MPGLVSKKIKNKKKRRGGIGEKVFPCTMWLCCSEWVCLSQKRIGTATPGIFSHQTFPVLMSAIGEFLLYDVIQSTATVVGWQHTFFSPILIWIFILKMFTLGGGLELWMLQSPTPDFNVQADVGKENRTPKGGRMDVENDNENSSQFGNEFKKGFCQPTLV